jgi:hypothetical protein
VEIDAQKNSYVDQKKPLLSTNKDVEVESKGNELLDNEPAVDYAAASTYNIYFRKDQKEHFIITPITSPEREKAARLLKNPKDFDVFKDAMPKAAEDNTLFVHKPYLSFHHPPRTLRRGPYKHSPVICLINNSWFWRKWILQFGERLAEDGVVDPRGVLSEKHGAERKDENGLRTKGYKIRSWRLWGESGKMYHRETNEQRKAGWLATNTSDEIPGKPLVEEVVYFSWHSPFTHKTRLYRFNYDGLEFYWKGTGTVKESRTCGWWLRFHHVKLCVRIPVFATANTSENGGLIRRTTTWGSILTRFGSKDPGFREVCLAKYTSSIGRKKAGILQIYDDALHRLLIDGVIPLDIQKKRALEDAGVVGVKKLRLYEVIIATAMCMVIGEWQKRETVWAILAAAAEGGGG